MILYRGRVGARMCFFVRSFAGHGEFVAGPSNGYSLATNAICHARCEMKLADQVAIITGAGRNIGEETAKLFAAEGASIAVVDMDRMRADKVAAAILAAGGKAKAYICDVSQEEQIIATVKAVAAEWGRLDILINNVA